jgi:ribonuclease P protein component
MRYRADQHLRRASDFQHIRTHGRRYDCGAFVFWHVSHPADLLRAGDSPLASQEPSVLTTPSHLRARLGVVASKSAVGNAVARAKAKRRLRELFRAHQAMIPAGIDILLVARGSLNGLEYAALEQRFVDACRKLFPHAARTSTPPASAD